MQRVVPDPASNGFLTLGSGTAIQMRSAAGSPIPPTRPFGTGVVSSVGAPFPTNPIFSVNAFPWIEIGPDPVVPGRNNIYVSAANDPDGVAVGTDGGDIRFVRSIDGGLTWQPAITINTDPIGKSQVFPAMSVD